MDQQKSIVNETIKAVNNTAGKVASAVNKTEVEIEKAVAPVRKHVIKKYPVLFLLMVTLGLTATITGMEQIILQIDFLQNHPSVVLIIGLVLLILTGTLYKKLG